MSRSLAPLITFALLLSACGGDAEAPLPTEMIPSARVGWDEPLDGSVFGDPSTPFLAGELISYGYLLGGFQGENSPQVLYSDGTAAGTRFLLAAELELDLMMGARRGQPWAVSDGANGYFIATIRSASELACAERTNEAGSCPGDRTSLYWTDGVQSIRLADLPRARQMDPLTGEVSSIALVRKGERSAACVISGSDYLGGPLEETWRVLCYEGRSSTPVELVLERSPFVRPSLIGLGSSLYISEIGQELLIWDPWSGEARARAIGVAPEQIGELLLVRGENKNSPTALLFTESGLYLIDAAGRTSSLVGFVGSDLGPEDKLGLLSEFDQIGSEIDPVEVGETLYIGVETTYRSRSDQPMEPAEFVVLNRVYAYDAITHAPIFVEPVIFGGLSLLLEGAALWAVGERAVYEVTRNGLVERDSRDDNFKSPVLVPTGVLGEAYLGYEDLTEEIPTPLWLYLAPGAPAQEISRLGPEGDLADAQYMFAPGQAHDGELYLLGTIADEGADLIRGVVIVADQTEARVLDLPDEVADSLIGIRRIGDRLIGLLEAEPSQEGRSRVRLTAIAPR